MKTQQISLILITILGGILLTYGLIHILFFIGFGDDLFNGFKMIPWAAFLLGVSSFTFGLKKLSKQSC